MGLADLVEKEILLYTAEVDSHQMRVLDCYNAWKRKWELRLFIDGCFYEQAANLGFLVRSFNKRQTKPFNTTLTKEMFIKVENTNDFNKQGG